MPSWMRCINATARCATLFRNERLTATGLTGSQHSYILVICKNPGMSQEQLARRLYIHKSNVARQLAQLEQAGFITRRPGESDKRVLLVYPTQKAHDVFPAIRAALDEWSTYLAADFSPEERDMLGTLLNHIMERASAYIGERGIMDGEY